MLRCSALCKSPEIKKPSKIKLQALSAMSMLAGGPLEPVIGRIA